MRAVLQAISEELLRLKAEGETMVPVSEETMRGLRALVKAQASGAESAAVEEPALPASSPAARPPNPLRAEREAAQARLAPSAPAVPATSVAPVRGLVPAAPPAGDLPPPPVVRLPEGGKAVRWGALKEAATNDPVCLAKVRPGKKAVLGVGSLDAKIFFVGEAPGAEEEVVGEPFVGPAGQLLTKMIAAMGLKREQVYIGNIMCWRPQMPTPPGAEQIGNRPPTPE